MNLDVLTLPSDRSFHAVHEDAEVLLEALVPLAKTENVVLRHLRGTRMGSPWLLFDEWAAALQFPPYFGENWDAFDECLNDLSWLPPVDPCVLLILDAHTVLDHATHDELEILAKILKETATAWNGHRAFHFILQSPPEALESALAMELRRQGLRFQSLV